MNVNEETQLSNFKAHRAQLLGEVRIANDELSDVLKKKEEAEATCAAAVKREKEAEEHLASLLVELRDAEDARDKAREETILQHTETRAAIEKAELAVAQADAHILSLEERGMNLEADILDLEEKTSQKEEDLEDLSLEYELNAALNEVAKMEHSEWRKQVGGEQSNAQTALRLAQLETLREQEKLEETRALVTAEIKKIEEPGKKLAQDFAFISRMRRNVDVYAARVKRKHEELYPDKPFTI